MRTLFHPLDSPRSSPRAGAWLAAAALAFCARAEAAQQLRNAVVSPPSLETSAPPAWKGASVIHEVWLRVPFTGHAVEPELGAEPVPAGLELEIQPQFTGPLAPGALAHFRVSLR